MPITLYRGITVKLADVAAVRERIRTLGLTDGQGQQWHFTCVDLRPRLSELFEKPNLTTDDTRPSRIVRTGRESRRELIGGFPAICACADDLGASYYALRHNQNRSEGRTHGLVVTFRAELADIHIDGRDFLYNSVFRDACVPEQRACACTLFGDRLGRYLDRAMAHTDTSYKFAMCDLAVQDEEIVRDHARNDTAIGGRYGTCFRSAFFVRTPVAPANIISVDDAKDRDFTPQVTLDSFRKLAEKTG